MRQIINKVLYGILVGALFAAAGFRWAMIPLARP